jgi:hypothetical protein
VGDHFFLDKIGVSRKLSAAVRDAAASSDQKDIIALSPAAEGA